MVDLAALDDSGFDATLGEEVGDGGAEDARMSVPGSVLIGQEGV